MFANLPKGPDLFFPEVSVLLRVAWCMCGEVQPSSEMESVKASETRERYSTVITLLYVRSDGPLNLCCKVTTLV